MKCIPILCGILYVFFEERTMNVFNKFLNAVSVISRWPSEIRWKNILSADIERNQIFWNMERLHLFVYLLSKWKRSFLPLIWRVTRGVWFGISPFFPVIDWRRRFLLQMRNKAGPFSICVQYVSAEFAPISSANFQKKNENRRCVSLRVNRGI